MAELSVRTTTNARNQKWTTETTMSKNYYRTNFNFMGFGNFGKTQLGKYSDNFNWEGAIKRPL